MIDTNAILRYRKQFPESSCGYTAHDGTLFVTSEAGDIYTAPEGETTELFLGRLKRSKAEGKNLFFDEWDKQQKQEKEAWW